MKSKRDPLFHYYALSIVFLISILFVPASQRVMETYNLSAGEYRGLLLLYILPYFAIWFAAFFAFSRLKRYSETIKGSPEADGFKALAKGCGWMAYSLPVGIFIALILFGIANVNPDFRPAAVIISNYSYMILPLVGFILLARSARRLSKQAGINITSDRARKIIVAFIILGLIYCFFSLRNFDFSSILSTQNAYFLPVGVVVATLTLPYLYGWFVGLLAAYEIHLFARMSKGLIYRRALLFVAYGIATVIASSIALQYVYSVSPRTGQLSISAVVATAYLVNSIAVIGYALIAYGAIKLKRIEEV